MAVILIHLNYGPPVALASWENRGRSTTISFGRGVSGDILSDDSGIVGLRVISNVSFHLSVVFIRSSVN